MNGNGKKNHRKRWIFVGLGLVACFCSISVIAATRGGTKIDPSKLAKVKRGDLAKSVVATGKVTPITKVEMKSKASGIVTRLYVDAGNRVKKVNCWHNSIRKKSSRRWRNQSRLTSGGS